MMASGRYPVTGYKTDGSPIIDDKSGYEANGFLTVGCILLIETKVLKYIIA